MYLEFSSRVLNTSRHPGWVYHLLVEELDRWSIRYQVPYRKKIVKDKVRVTFDDEKYYDFFTLTWHPEHYDLVKYFTVYTIKEPMSRV